MSLSPITPALAAGAAANPQAETMQFILFIVVFALFFYMVLWRPQAKRAKEQREMLSKLATGDEVLTSGGFVGKISKLSDDFVTLTVANGVDMTIQKSAIAGTLPKGTMQNM